MRIAIITENFLPKLYGVTRTLAMLLEHLQWAGHQALVLGPESGSPIPENDGGVRSTSVWSTEKAGRGWNGEASGLFLSEEANEHLPIPVLPPRRAG